MTINQLFCKNPDSYILEILLSCFKLEGIQAVDTSDIQLLTIPMATGVESLNVSVSSGIALYKRYSDR